MTYERYLWKRIPSNIKVDESSELFHLWTVNKYLIGNDTTNALAVLLERSKDFTGAECGAWEVLGPELASELILRLRSHQAESILSSYDVITLDSAAAMLQLSKEDCKQGKLIIISSI